jgi:Leucine-rich repeat (LRR) protein
MHPTEPRKRKVVVTVHGIRTYGKWQTRLEKLIVEEDGTIDANFNHYCYGYFTIFSFVIPFLRSIAVKKFRDRFQLLIDSNKDAEVIIFAHSFGTYLSINAINMMTGIKPGQIPLVVLCGSVLPPDFDFAHLVGADRKISRLYNECGIFDNVLALTLLLPGIGPGGRLGFHGFQSSQIQNRYYKLSHSGFFDQGPDGSSPFIKSHWLPLLSSDGEPRRHDERPDEASIWDRAFRMLAENSSAVTIALYAILATAFLLPVLSILDSQRREAALLELREIGFIQEADHDDGLAFSTKFAQEPVDKVQNSDLTRLIELSHRLKPIEILDLSNSDVDSLAGIGQLSMLRQLTLPETFSNIDLSPLSDLQSLEILDLSCNAIPPVNPDDIDQTWCRSGLDLTPLAGLQGLRELHLTLVDGAVHLNGLEGLQALEILDLSGASSVEDLGPLSDLPSLRSLDLSGATSIESIGPITKVASLKELNLEGLVKLRELPELGALIDLVSLRISESGQIDDLAGLSELYALRELYIMDLEKIDDIGPVRGLRELEVLYLRGMDGLSDLTPISELTALQQLDLSGSDHISDLSPLSNLRSLNSLNVFGANYITDLSPIDCSDIQFISASDLQIESCDD